MVNKVELVKDLRGKNERTQRGVIERESGIIYEVLEREKEGGGGNDICTRGWRRVRVH